MGGSPSPQYLFSGANKGAVIIYSENPRTFGYDRVRQGLGRSGWAAWMLESDSHSDDIHSDNIQSDSGAARVQKPRPRKAPKTT